MDYHKDGIHAQRRLFELVRPRACRRDVSAVWLIAKLEMSNDRLVHCRTRSRKPLTDLDLEQRYSALVLKLLRPDFSIMPITVSQSIAFYGR